MKRSELTNIISQAINEAISHRHGAIRRPIARRTNINPEELAKREDEVQNILKKYNSGEGPDFSDDLFESKINGIIKKNIKKVLKESMDIQNFKEELRQNFYETLESIYKDTVDEFCDGEKYGPDYFMDLAEEMAEINAEELTNDSIKVLNSDDWDIPKSNFRPLGFVMEREHGIHNLQELLASPNPVEIYTNWFWDAFGTFGTKYNFQNVLSDELYELEQQEDENNSEE